MEYEGMKWVFQELRFWVEKFSEWGRKPEEEEEAALTAFLDALNETTIYLGRIQIVLDASTREDEERLSRLWREAAQKVRKYNPELAQRCSMKGAYWADRYRWSDEEIHEMQISIKEITKFANRALASA
jgi:hypothetical protein